MTSDGDVCLVTGAAGFLSITNPIAAGTGTVRINSADTVDQSGTGTITAQGLGILSVDTVMLELANNDVDTLSVEVTGAGSGMFFRDADDLTVGAVADSAGECFGLGGGAHDLDGIVTNGGDVCLRTATATGFVNITNPIDAGVGTVRINSADTVDQAGPGAITAQELGIVAVDTVLLNLITNDVDVLAASVPTEGVTFTYTDADSFSVGPVTDSIPACLGGTVTGIDTAGGDLTLLVNGTGNLTILDNLNTAGALNAGNVNLTTNDGSIIVRADIYAAGAGVGGNGGNVTLTIPTGGADAWLPGVPALATNPHYWRPAEVIVFGDPSENQNITVNALGTGAGTDGTIALAGARAVVPGVATIWGKVPLGRSVTLVGGNVVMGQNEKFTCQGHLYIGATTMATIGDLTAAGNLTVSSPTVTFLDRQAGNFGDPYRGRVKIINAAGQIYGDPYLDFVAGVTLLIPNVPGSANGPWGGVGTNLTGGAQGALVGGNFGGAAPPVWESFGPLTFAPPSPPAPDGSGIWLLDEVESGTFPVPIGDLATALASALPDTEMDVTTESSVPAGQREDLVRHLGIFTKDPNDDELVDFLCGRRFFMDTPEFVHVITAGHPVPDPGSTSPSQHKASIDRLPGTMGRDGLMSYRALYWRQKVDPKTGRKTWISLAAQIRDVLGKSITAYKGEHKGEFDPLGYRKWLAAKADQKKALELMAGLSSLFRQVELLGLGPVELANSHRMLARSIKPRGVTVEQLIDAVKVSPQDKGAVATAAK